MNQYFTKQIVAGGSREAACLFHKLWALSSIPCSVVKIPDFSACSCKNYIIN